MQEVNIILKNPYGSDFSITVSLSISVLELKQLVQAEHPDKPPIDRQRIIFSGRHLQDNEILSSILRADQHDLTMPQKFHLTIRPDLTQPANRNVGQQQQPPQPNWGAYNNTVPPNTYRYGQPQYHNFAQPFGGFQQYNVQQGAYPPQWGYPGNVPNANFPQQAYYPGQYPGMGMAMGVGVGGPYGVPPQVHRVGFARINIDFSLIIKLMLLVYFFGQGGGSERTAILVALAIAYYLYQTGIARFVRVAPNVPQNAQQAQPGHVQAPGNGQGNAQRNVEPDRENVGQNNMQQQNDRNEQNVHNPVGIMGEIVSFFVAFVCSLFPSWQPPENINRRQQPQDNVNGQEENDNHQ